MAKSFRNLKLGFASAEKEGASEPELLLDGYLDHSGVIEEALNGSKYLFLGYKGSGKSAIGQHLWLRGKRESQLFVVPTVLSDFPFSDFRNIAVGNDETKYPTAWSWILLLHLFASFSQDMGVLNAAGDDFFEAITTLESLGLLPLPNLRQVVQVSSRKQFKIGLGNSVQTTFERTGQQQGLQIPFFAEKLKAIAQTFTSDSKHLLIIDGLDDILTGGSLRYDILAGLALEVSRLNDAFQQSGTPAKILLLCRTDLYEKLPGANKNKIRQDNAVVLDWYHDTRQPQESDLIKLANLRTSLSEPMVTDMFTYYFPDEVKGRKTDTYILELTRHTPRDLIQVLTHIQKFVHGGKVSLEALSSGVRSYSIEYLLPEIKDEMAGYVSPDEVKIFLELITSLGKRAFLFAELVARSNEKSCFCEADILSITNALFECSALGNVRQAADGTNRYTWKYRNRNAALNTNDQIVIHRGLLKAMNLE